MPFCSNDWLREAEEEDHKKRDEFIANQIKRQPENMVCSSVIGGSHCRSGKHVGSKPPANALEDAILAIGPVNLQVWEDDAYNRLSEFQTKVEWIGPDTSIEEFRNFILHDLRPRPKKK